SVQALGARIGSALSARNATNTSWTDVGAAGSGTGRRCTIRATSRSPAAGRAVGARHGTALGGTRAGDAVARRALVNLRRILQDLAFPHLAALPTLELPDKVREQTHGNVGIHERDAELLREDEQVDGVVVPDAHLHVLRVEVEEEQAPKGLLDDLQGAPPAAHAVPRSQRMVGRR